MKKNKLSIKRMNMTAYFLNREPDFVYKDSY